MFRWMCLCSQGVIEAHSLLHVPLDVTVQEREEQETTAHFVIVGSRGFSLVSKIQLHFVAEIVVMLNAKSVMTFLS